MGQYRDNIWKNNTLCALSMLAIVFAQMLGRNVVKEKVDMLYVVLIPFILLLIVRFWFGTAKNKKNVCIVVLGDLGRSPRMQYHALSFAKEGFSVGFVGYAGSSPLKELFNNARVQIRYLRPPPDLRNKLPQTLNYIVKVLWQCVTLFYTLSCNHVPMYLLLQNPPAIPTIPICWFYCLLTEAQLVIDWHNYAHTIMALNLGKGHVLVKLAKLIETFFGSKAHNNICVTRAMKEDLEQEWGIKAQVLYDRPPDEFHMISLSEKHEFLLRMSENYDVFRGTKGCSTIFTECLSDKVELLNNRPGLIVSSTSWTEDEDFSILLGALEDYEHAFHKENIDLPNLICVITGKGPLKDFYNSIIALKKWKHVTILTPWLENEDYPKMLACADLGISLHTSSSGLDLPMKVVDMFGCGVPVCAYNFKCLSELVKHKENSFVFSNPEELAEQLMSWFCRFPNNEKQQCIREKFQAELAKFQENRWHGNWLFVLPCFNPS